MCWSAILIMGRVHIPICSENVWGQAAGDMCHKCTFQVTLNCIHWRCTLLSLPSQDSRRLPQLRTQ